MIACVLQLVVHRLRTGKFKTMHIVTVAVVLVLGRGNAAAARPALHPMEAHCAARRLTAAVFLGSMFIGKQPLARRMLEAAFDEPIDSLRRAPGMLINFLWVAWFALLAAAESLRGVELRRERLGQFQGVRHHHRHCSSSCCRRCSGCAARPRPRRCPRNPTGRRRPRD